MNKILSTILLLLILLQTTPSLAQQQRFPKPEFHTEYSQPDTSTPEPRSQGMDYFDLVLLVVLLSLSAWLALKKRSRKGILWVSVFALIYFGFIREGCICSIGSVQNIALSLFDDGYSASIVVVLFFAIPIVFSLFYGRIFCSSVCPLGALQDLTLIKPIKVPKWVQKTLGLFPVVYLGLAILYAATGTDFIICRYDPFVGIFRMGAPFHMLILGASFILIGMFVARPYCRFVCPYGVLLDWASRLSKSHLTISPSKCVQCRLCENSCPFDAIETPSNQKEKVNSEKNVKRYKRLLMLVPVWIFVLGFSMSHSNEFFSRVHPDVALAEILTVHPELKYDQENLDIKTFMASDRTFEELVESAKVIQHKFYTVGWIIGCFIGLIIGLTIANQFRFRKRENYEPNRGECFSCARCIDYCPVKPEKNNS